MLRDSYRIWPCLARKRRKKYLRIGDGLNPTTDAEKIRRCRQLISIGVQLNCFGRINHGDGLYAGSERNTEHKPCAPIRQRKMDFPLLSSPIGGAFNVTGRAVSGCHSLNSRQCTAGGNCMNVLCFPGRPSVRRFAMRWNYVEGGGCA